MPSSFDEKKSVLLARLFPEQLERSLPHITGGDVQEMRKQVVAKGVTGFCREQCGQMVNCNRRNVIVHPEQRCGKRRSHVDERKRIVRIASVAAHVANNGKSALLLNQDKVKTKKAKLMSLCLTSIMEEVRKGGIFPTKRMQFTTMSKSKSSGKGPPILFVLRTHQTTNPIFAFLPRLVSGRSH
jgi:hypothetical protein